MSVHEAELVEKVEPVIPPCEVWITFYWCGSEWCVRTIGASKEFVESRQEVDGRPYRTFHLTDRPSTAAAVVEAAVDCVTSYYSESGMPDYLMYQLNKAVKAHLAAKAKNEGS